MENESPLRIVRNGDMSAAAVEPGIPGMRMNLGAMMSYAATRPEPKWIVPGYLTEGLTVFAGNSKIGKSYVCLDIAAAVASGVECLGGMVCEKGDVLYVAAEDSPQRIISRLEDWNPDKSTWPLTALDFVTAPMMRPAPEVVREWLDESANPRLVILDTLARTIPEVDSRKGAYDKDVERLARVQEFASKSGIAVLVVTHTRQMKLEEGEDWMSKVSGTTGIVGTADHIMFLDAQRGSPDGTLHVTGRDMSDRDDPVRRVGPWWQVFAPGVIGTLGDRSVQIIEFVEASPGPVGAVEVSTALSLPRATVDTYLGRLVRSGKLQRYGRGKYWKPGQAE